MSDYDCVGVTSDYLNSLKNKITELEQQNKYLTEQNKAFQEEYNTSGDIIRELRQQNKELIEFIEDIVNYEAERVLREREILLNKYK